MRPLSSLGQSNLVRHKPLADINVTPMVDVMLVLLIIFMVTAPMLSTGLKVNLPQAKQATPVDQKAPISITVSQDGTIAVDAQTVEHDQVIPTVEAKLGGDKTRVIQLRGDRDAPFGNVVRVMDLLASDGLTHIAILARLQPAGGAGASAQQEAPQAPASNLDPSKIP